MTDFLPILRICFVSWSEIPLSKKIETLYLPLEGKPTASNFGNPHCSFFVNDIEEYKKFKFISEIILFDSKGYEKSIGFNHRLLNNVSTSVKKMLAGNIQYNDKLDKYSKITDIIDISGSLETSGEKDISKIKIFLENISKIKNEN